MNAYDKIYLDDAMHNFGAMVDCAVNTLSCSAGQFWNRFLASSIEDRFSRGAVDVIAGHSGVELALMVLAETGAGPFTCAPEISISSPEYWAGISLAYYQWSRGLSFKELSTRGLGLENVVGMFYPFHEADHSTFAQAADEIIDENFDSAVYIKRMRKLNGMTQEELSGRSGVSIRLIRAYEQGTIELRHAESSTVSRLFSALNIPLYRKG